MLNNSYHIIIKRIKIEKKISSILVGRVKRLSKEIYAAKQKQIEKIYLYSRLTEIVSEHKGLLSFDDFSNLKKRLFIH